MIMNLNLVCLLMTPLVLKGGDDFETLDTTLFETLDNFGSFSGCKVNNSKSEGIWLGSLKGNDRRPVHDQGLAWNNSDFLCASWN